MSIRKSTDAIASYYPILDSMQINGVEIKWLLNLNQVYKLIKRLGHGAEGKVNCYRERATGNLYAFKEIRIHDQINIQELHTEVKILAQLSAINPSIVKYQDSFVYMKDDRVIYVIVTDYVQGFTLNEYINALLCRDQLAPFATIFNLAVWLYSVIDALHTAGYAHRDIKPENIMVDTGRNQFVLIDFGLSCPLKQSVHLTKITGTPEFIAPERWILKKKSKFSIRSSDLSILKKADVWAAGITLYCVMEKRFPWDVPFEAPNYIYATGRRIIDNYPVTFTYPHAILVQIVTAAITPDPQLRPSAHTLLDLIKQPLRESGPIYAPIYAPEEDDYDDEDPIKFDAPRVHEPRVHEPHIPRLQLNLSDESPRSREHSPAVSPRDSPRGSPSPRTYLQCGSPPESPRRSHPLSGFQKKISPRIELLSNLRRKFA